MSISPTQRSLAKLRKEGYLVAIVERWNPFAKIRQDLYCFVDILGLKEGETLAVQTTTLKNQLDRVKKIKEHPNYNILKGAGWRIVVHGWRRLKTGWECREIEL
jgi:hypothetical protein